MSTIDIQIRKNSHGNLSAYVDRGGRIDSFNELFQFAYRKDEQGNNGRWLFWLTHHNHPTIFACARKDFPMQFFLDACRAKYFIRYQAEMPADIQITHGHGHIGMKKQ